MISETALLAHAQRLRTLLAMERPLVFFDLESTGTNPETDRIVSLALVKVCPDGTLSSRAYRINPEAPIPPEATYIHHIADADVAGCPTFADLAGPLLEFIGPADLAGFNVLRFDLPLLVAEFRRAGLTFTYLDRAVIDLMVIYHQLCPRDLASAVTEYAQADIDAEQYSYTAHDATDDAEVCLPVLIGQIARHGDILPCSAHELGRYCWGDRVDLGGKFRRDAEGEVVFAFSKAHTGDRLSDVARTDPSFCRWILGHDFPPDVQQLVRGALDREAEDRRRERENQNAARLTALPCKVYGDLPDGEEKH